MKVTSRDLQHHIKNGRIENVYLLSGPEVGEKNDTIELIEKTVFLNEEPSKYTFYYGVDFNLADFMNTLKSGLLFSEKKLVILKNVEDVNSEFLKYLEQYILPKSIDANVFEKNVLSKISASDKKKPFLVKYQKQNDQYVLSETAKAKDKKNLIEFFYSIGFQCYDKNTFLIMLNETNDRIPQGLLDLLAPAQKIIFWEMFESQKSEWVRQEFKKYNLFINNEAVSCILNMVENNKEELRKEISKISLLFRDGSNDGKKEISREFFEEYLFHSKVESPFSLYSAMLDKNLSKAMDVLDSLFLTDEFGLLNGLVWSHRRFLKAIDLFENHRMPINEVFLNLKITAQKNKEDFKAGFDNYSFYHASLMYYYLSELDYYLKILPNDMKLIKLQEFVINFIKGDMRKSFFNGPLLAVQA